MATITKEMIINDIVHKYPATMKVLNDFKVDSCCGGGQSIAATAAVGNVDIPQLMDALNQAVDKES